MKLKSFALTAVAAVTTMAAVSAAHAQSSTVSIYGILDAGVQYSKGANSVSRVQSGGQSGSRIGFRGNEDLGGGLHAIFTIESGINLDDGTNGQNSFWGRQAFVGLTSATLGTVTLGRQYSSLYTFSNEFSEFANVSAGASTAVIGGFANGYEPIRGSNSSGTGNGGPARDNNSVKYESPSFYGFKVGGLAGLGEASTGTNKTRVGDIYVRYTQGPIDAGISYVTDKSLAQNINVSTTTGVASYNFGTVKVTGGWMHVDDRSNNNQDGNGGWIGGDWRFASAQTVRAQYVLNKAQYGSKGKTQAYGVGYQYDLSKRTDVYAMLTRFTNKGDGYTDRYNSAIPAGLTDVNHRNINEMMLGVKHAF